MRQIATLIALMVTMCLTAAPRAQAETLIVKISGLHGTAGVVRVIVWKDALGFPTKPEKGVANKSLPVTGPELELSFPGLPRGTYAVAAYHDENNNGKLDLSFFGWPIEATAASRGASGMMGPPKFSDAAFELKQSEQTIQLKFK